MATFMANMKNLLLQVILLSAANLLLTTTASTVFQENAQRQDERILPKKLLCRCQADFENFYHRRLGNEDLQDLHFDRQLGRSYGRVQISHDGYFIVDGVKVLPCRDSSSGGASRADHFYDIFNGFRGIFNNRRLHESDGEEFDDAEDLDKPDLRRMLGTFKEKRKRSMGKKGGYYGKVCPKNVTVIYHQTGTMFTYLCVCTFQGKGRMGKNGGRKV